MKRLSLAITLLGLVASKRKITPSNMPSIPRLKLRPETSRATFACSSFDSVSNNSLSSSPISDTNDNFPSQIASLIQQPSATLKVEKRGEPQ